MASKKAKNWKLVAVGIVCLTAAEIAALYNGINGVVFTAFVAVVAAAIGVAVPTPKFK